MVIHGLGFGLSMDLDLGYPWTRARVIHGLGFGLSMDSGLCYRLTMVRVSMD